MGPNRREQARALRIRAKHVRDTALGIPVSGIIVGKCYLTALGQARRVVKFDNGRVTYESRGKTADSWRDENTVLDGRFARDVEREVPLRLLNLRDQGLDFPSPIPSVSRRRSSPNTKGGRTQGDRRRAEDRGYLERTAGRRKGLVVLPGYRY
jgi:hypothetical protein